MFESRKDAGRKLGKALEKYKNKNCIVLAIPKGGIEVGIEAAKYINADFSLIIVRKLPFPDEPEAGFGAIAEDGTMYINPNIYNYLEQETIESVIDGQRKEIERRISILRKGSPLPPLENRTAILVDDGIAAGSTMRGAVMMLRGKRAGKIIIASPVAGAETVAKLTPLVDEVIVLETPDFFRAVAQVYNNWHDVSDEEALELLKTRNDDRGS